MHRWVAWWAGLRDLCSTALVLRGDIYGALALTALDNGIMTPWALENIATYQQYGSVEAALAAGKTFHILACKPMLDSFIFLVVARL